MAIESIEDLVFTRDWENHEDFPTREPSENKVRYDIQYLYNEIKNFINGKLVATVNALVDAFGDLTEISILPGSITTEKLDHTEGSEAVDSGAIRTNAIRSRHIYPGDIGTSHLENNAVTEDKLNKTSGSEAVTTATIRDGAVTEAKIGNGAVTTSKLGTGSVTMAKLAGSAVIKEKIADGAVSESKLVRTSGSEAVTTATIRDGAVTTAKLEQTSGSEAVTTDTIRDGAVTTAKLADDAVTAGKIKDGEVTFDKLEGLIPLSMMKDVTSFTVHAAVPGPQYAGTVKIVGGTPGCFGILILSGGSSACAVDLISRPALSTTLVIKSLITRGGNIGIDIVTDVDDPPYVVYTNNSMDVVFGVLIGLGGTIYVDDEES